MTRAFGGSLLRLMKSQLKWEKRDSLLFHLEQCILNHNQNSFYHYPNGQRAPSIWLYSLLLILWIFCILLLNNNIGNAKFNSKSVSPSTAGTTIDGNRINFFCCTKKSKVSVSFLCVQHKKRAEMKQNQQRTKKHRKYQKKREKMWQRKEENRRFPFTAVWTIRFLLLIRASSQKEVNRQRQFVRVSFFLFFFLLVASKMQETKVQKRTQSHSFDLAELFLVLLFSCWFPFFLTKFFVWIYYYYSFVLTIISALGVFLVHWWTKNTKNEWNCVWSVWEI